MKRRRQVDVSESEEEDIDSEDIDSEEEDDISYDSKDVKKITDYIKREELTVDSISKNRKISLKDKAYLFQLYEIYKYTEPYTIEHLNARTKLFSEYSNLIEQQKFDISPVNESSIPDMISALETSKINKQLIYSRYKKYSSLSTFDDEKYKLQHWLDIATSLPFDRIQSISSNVKQVLLKVKNDMDENLYGMENAKNQILIFLANKLMNGSNMNIGFIGNAGTGKTALALSLSKSLNLPFERIACGGIQDSSFLSGHSYTYIGADCGEIVKCLQRMKCNNGIIFFDEYEKISSQVSATLLHITDPLQNHDFRDTFLSGLQINLSNVWFMYSMNKKPADRALCDRIFFVDVPDYNDDEKFHIINDYIIPKTGKKLKSSTLSITKEFIEKIIRDNPDFSIRDFERYIYNLIAKKNYEKIMK